MMRPPTHPRHSGQPLGAPARPCPRSARRLLVPHVLTWPTATGSKESLPGQDREKDPWWTLFKSKRAAQKTPLLCSTTAPPRMGPTPPTSHRKQAGTCRGHQSVHKVPTGVTRLAGGRVAASRCDKDCGCAPAMGTNPSHYVLCDLETSCDLSVPQVHSPHKVPTGAVQLDKSAP